MSYINSNHKPLIFIGSSLGMLKHLDVCIDHNISVHGLIDQDYYGNTDSLHGVPVIDSEISFNDPEKLKYYQENFVFFCATTWLPTTDEISIRNQIKRQQHLSLLDEKNLPTISLVSRCAYISHSAKIGKGVFVDAFSHLEPGVVFDDYVSAYPQSFVGHDTTVGRNSVIQRQTRIKSYVTIEKNVYFGTNALIAKPHITISENTFVHEGIILYRGTVANEIVHMEGRNLKRVYNETAFEVK